MPGTARPGNTPRLMNETPVPIREARDDDADAIIELIRGVYAEYPNCILDVPGEEPELLAVKTAFAAKGGNFWVAEDQGQVVGTLAYFPHSDEKWELKKLYVHASARRRGLARQLMNLVEQLAQQHDVKQLSLWTDTRFVEAHAFYEALAYRRTGRDRQLGDVSETTEIEFIKSL